MKSLRCLAVCLFAASAVAAEFDDAKYNNWHQWRGPDASGVAKQADPPTTWSEDENVSWKAHILGRGSSMPIVWGNIVFMLG